MFPITNIWFRATREILTNNLWYASLRAGVLYIVFDYDETRETRFYVIRRLIYNANQRARDANVNSE